MTRHSLPEIRLDDKVGDKWSHSEAAIGECCGRRKWEQLQQLQLRAARDCSKMNEEECSLERKREQDGSPRCFGQDMKPTQEEDDDEAGEEVIVVVVAVENENENEKKPQGGEEEEVEATKTEERQLKKCQVSETGTLIINIIQQNNSSQNHLAQRRQQQQQQQHREDFTATTIDSRKLATVTTGTTQQEPQQQQQQQQPLSPNGAALAMSCARYLKRGAYLFAKYVHCKLISGLFLLIALLD